MIIDTQFYTKTKWSSHVMKLKLLIKKLNSEVVADNLDKMLA